MARRMYDENQIKSIASEAGGSKLYRHDVYMRNASDVTQNARAAIISSSSIVVDSLTDLNTVTKDAAYVPFSGRVKSGSTYCPVCWYIKATGKLLGVLSSGSSGDVQVDITGWTITDTVTEI